MTSDKLADETTTELSESETATDLSESSSHDMTEEIKANGVWHILSTLQETNDLIKKYETETVTKFSCYTAAKNFGNIDMYAKKHKIYWNDDVLKFDGIPFIIVGQKTLDCHYGKDRSGMSNKKIRDKKKETKVGDAARENTVVHTSKKLGCKAQIFLKEIVRFPDYKIPSDSKWRRETVSKLIRQAFSQKCAVGQQMFRVFLPDVNSHTQHLVGEGYDLKSEMVHKDLVVKAQELYLQDYSINDILKSLHGHVINEMFWKRDPPDPNRRRFYPSVRDVQLFIGRIRKLAKITSEEEDNLRKLVDKIQLGPHNVNVLLHITDSCKNEHESDSCTNENKLDSSDEFCEVETENSCEKKKKDEKKVQTVLFCYQTPQQKRLLKRYGNQVYLVEIKCASTIKRALTIEMYALLVQTNVDFQVVGSFICSKQRRDGVTEALNVFKEWNTYWQPKYFLVDCSEKISNAITSVFPDVCFFFDPLACEKKWMEFINTPSNDTQDDADDIIKFLKSMMFSLTEDSLTMAASLLETSDIWRYSTNLRSWFQDIWLHNAKKWVFGYRPDDLIVLDHSSSTVYDFIKPYEEALYQSTKPNGFVTMVEQIAYSISEEEYKKYVDRNKQLYLSSKKFSNCCMSPSFRGMPFSMLPSVYEVSKLAESYTFNITHNQLGLFAVQCTSPKSKINEESFLEAGEVIEVCTTTDNDNGDKQSPEADNILEACAAGNAENSTLPISVAACTSGTFKHTQESHSEASEVMEAGQQRDEVIVTFGDLYSYPFCTCSHWQFYKLPCVHMFAIYRQIPGWNYDMLSPLYRSNSVLNIDHSCLDSDSNNTANKYCQTTTDDIYKEKHTMEESTFLSVEQIEFNMALLQQCKDFLQNIDKLAFLFRDRMHHKKLREDLNVLLNEVNVSTVNNNHGCIKHTVEPLISKKHKAENILYPTVMTKKHKLEKIYPTVKDPIIKEIARLTDLTSSASSFRIKHPVRTKTCKPSNVNKLNSSQNIVLSVNDEIPLLVESDHTNVARTKRTPSVSTNNLSSQSSISPEKATTSSVCSTGERKLSMLTYLPKLKEKIVCSVPHKLNPDCATTVTTDYVFNENVTASDAIIMEDVRCGKEQNVTTFQPLINKHVNSSGAQDINTSGAQDIMLDSTDLSCNDPFDLLSDQC